MNDDLIQTRPYLFQEGHLRASDANTEAKASERFQEFVLELFERWPNSELAREQLRKNLTAISSNPRFKRMIIRMARGTDTHWAKIVFLAKIDQKLIVDILSQMEHKILESAGSRRKQLGIEASALIEEILKQPSKQNEASCDGLRKVAREG